MTIAEWMSKHGKIILASYTAGVKPGDVRPMANMKGTGECYKQPFLVTRIATRKEMAEQLRAMGLMPTAILEPYFYEVTTD